MAKLKKTDILTISDYNKIRTEFRERAIKIKNERRVHLGPYLTFLFENKDTMHYQVQEMLRAEQISKDEAVEHEVSTYNELVPEPYELTATLLVEFTDATVRAVKLRELAGLENHISLVIGDDNKVPAEFDERQLSEDKLSSVQYIKFKVGESLTKAIFGGSQIAIKADHGACSYEEMLSQEQRAALVTDLKETLES